MKTAKQALLDGVLGDSNPFVEEISYTVSGGEAKTINAVVNRTADMIQRDGIKNRSRYKAEIMISHDATSGIETPTPKEDLVTMASERLGSSSHTYQLQAIIGKTKMGWWLGLQQ